ncbi:hypothetical protein Tco_0184495 [Tanacetum coccineum]
MFSPLRVHPTDHLCLFLGNHLTKPKKGITMAKPIMDEARIEQSLAEQKTNSDVKFELNKELLTELRNNAYCEKVEEDFFPLSLAGNARKWWMNEGDGKINTSEELVKNFFGKFYPLSRVSNYDRMCEDDEEGCDSIEFITWMNSKFKDHKKVGETTKHALLHSWIEVGKNEGIIDDIVSSDDEWE